MRRHLRSWLPCGGLAILSILAAAAVSLAPPAAGPVAAVFPPWWSPAESLAAAGAAGTPVRFGATGFLVILMPDREDSMGMLRAAGAWFVLDPGALGGCLAA